METRIKTFKSQSFNRFAPFIVLAFIALTYSFTAKLGMIDDQYFVKIFTGVNHSLLEFIKLRFETWSSRIFIESLVVFFVNQHLLWRIINSITLFGTGIVLLKLIGKPDDYLKWMVVLLISLYPYTDMASAGWIATTLNYSWPLFFGLIALIPIRIYYDALTIPPVYYPVYVLVTLFAANVEQMAGILFLIFTVAILIDITRKRVKSLLVIQYLVIILNLILILVSPGNYVRRIAEIGTWFPEYAGLSIVRIIEMGFSSSFYPLVFKVNGIFLLFTVVTFIRAMQSKKNDLHLLISAIPISVLLIFNVFSVFLKDYFPVIEHIKQALSKIGTGASISQLVSLVPDLILLIIICSILWSLFMSTEKREKFLFIIGILGIGFISRFVIAFSPTIWASVERTFIFFYATIIYVTLLLIVDIVEASKQKMIENAAIKYAVLLLLVLSFINNLYLITYRF